MAQSASHAKYGPAKIKILQNWEEYAHHADHRINVCLNNYNAMVQMLFRTKGKLNIPAIMSLAKQMGLHQLLLKVPF